MIRVLGFGNILITGLQGAGKSHFVMSQIVQILNDPENDMSIYLVNVDGVTLKNSRLHIADADFSWVNDAPKNSFIIYDEAGTIERFNNSSTRINSDEQVQKLTMARHEGKTILFVAQDSSIIHPAIRKLLTRHYHFSNPYNDPKKTHCFVFPQVQDRLDGQNKYWQKNAIEEFKHDLDPEIFPLYKSVDDGAKHNKKKQFNPKAKRIIIIVGVMVTLLLPLFFYVIKGSLDFYKRRTSKTPETITASGTEPPKPISTVIPTNESQPIVNQSNQDYTRTIELYNEQLPKDYRILSDNDDLRVAGVMTMRGKCLAYNVKGERLTISQAECKDYLTESGKIIKGGSKTGVITQHNESSKQTEQQQKQSEGST